MSIYSRQSFRRHTQPHTNVKLVSLNIWGGTEFKPLMEFVRSSAQDTDIFCFQEVLMSNDGDRISNGARMNIAADLKRALPDFTSYFTPILEDRDLQWSVVPSVVHGEIMFVRQLLSVLGTGTLFVCGGYNEPLLNDRVFDVPSALQYARIRHGGKSFTIAQIHGISMPGSKLDTTERLEQSRNIISFFGEETGEKILCGDFNLIPDSESVLMIEQSGLRNLIKEFDIHATRPRTSTDRYPTPQFFADYCFVSPGVNVRQFAVPDVSVSDHLPLVLDFSL